jgi:ABC-type multidrug transport system permease subunit
MGALARYRYSAGMVNGLFGTIVLLGGFFVPTSAMPSGVRAISSAMPSTWAIQAVRPGVAHHWADLGIAGLLAVGWLAGGMVYLSGAARRLRKIGFYQQ